MEEAINSQELLERVGGDRELVSELLECFRRDYPAQIQQARAALVRAESKGVENAAHSLKGALANLAASNAHALAAQLENLGQSGQFSRAHEILADLERELERVATSLDTFCHGGAI